MERKNSVSAGKYALVTGASSGIGKAIAEECAAMGMNLLMVALPDTGLDRIAARIRADFGVQTEFLECDLALSETPERVQHWVRDLGVQLRMLVNNAGVDLAGRFDGRPLADHELMMNLNVLAVVKLTYLLLPELRRARNGFILNVASAAAFFPMPYKPIYSPSKTFVLNFSMAIREELKESNISVSALCPGGVMTNDDVRRRIELQGFFGKISRMFPEQLAAYTLPRVFRGQPVIVPGWLNKLFRVLGWLVPPAILIPFVHRRFRRDEVLLHPNPNAAS